MLARTTPDGPTHVRPAGEECSAGELLAPAGTVLNPALIGLAAASGHDELVVVPAPRVALVLFGDELATVGIPAPGLVRDSLGPQVPAWVARMGADVVLIERCEDTLAAHVEAIRRAAAAADVVLTTGGTAAGPVDHLHAAIGIGGGRGDDRQRGGASRASDAGRNAGSRSGVAGRAAGEPAERDRDPHEPGGADPGRACRAIRGARAGRGPLR